jgi:hypothetical protein
VAFRRVDAYGQGGSARRGEHRSGAATQRSRRAAVFPNAASLLLVLAELVCPTSAFADQVAIFRIDSLGVDSLIVARLEALLRMEVDRLVGEASPNKRRLARLLARRPRLRNCTGEVACLSEVGRLLEVQRVIAGNVGGLGDSYVVNLKLVDARQRREIRRVQETISGEPDQLIEAIRVAAYGLLAPSRLRGGLKVLATVAGADVLLDGRWLGKTPLPAQHGLRVGSHDLRVSKRDYRDAIQPVTVRFQKMAEVIVRLETPTAGRGLASPGQPQTRPVPWYTRWWFWTAVGVVAAGAGAAIAYGVSGNTGVNCSAEPERCGL